MDNITNAVLRYIYKQFHTNRREIPINRISQKFNLDDNNTQRIVRNLIRCGLIESRRRLGNPQGGTSMAITDITRKGIETVEEYLLREEDVENIKN